MSFFDRRIINLGADPIAERRIKFASLKYCQSDKEEDSLRNELVEQLFAEPYCNDHNRNLLLNWLDNLIGKLGSLSSSALLDSKNLSMKQERKRTTSEKRQEKTNNAQKDFLSRFGLQDYTVYDCLSYVLSNHPFEEAFKNSCQLIDHGSGGANTGRLICKEPLSKGRLHEYRAELSNLVSPRENKSFVLIDNHSEIDNLGIDLIVNGYPLQLKLDHGSNRIKSIPVYPSP